MADRSGSSFNVLPLDDRQIERFVPEWPGGPRCLKGNTQTLYAGMERLSENSVRVRHDGQPRLHRPHQPVQRENSLGADRSGRGRQGRRPLHLSGRASPRRRWRGSRTPAGSCRWALRTLRSQAVGPTGRAATILVGALLASLIVSGVAFAQVVFTKANRGPHPQVKTAEFRVGRKQGAGAVPRRIRHLAARRFESKPPQGRRTSWTMRRDRNRNEGANSIPPSGRDMAQVENAWTTRRRRMVKGGWDAWGVHRRRGALQPVVSIQRTP